MFRSILLIGLGLGAFVFTILALIVWYMFRTGSMVMIQGIPSGPEPVDPLLERDRRLVNGDHSQ
jgi:hypothetical protein